MFSVIELPTKTNILKHNGLSSFKQHDNDDGPQLKQLYQLPDSDWPRSFSDTYFPGLVRINIRPFLLWGCLMSRSRSRSTVSGSW